MATEQTIVDPETKAEQPPVLEGQAPVAAATTPATAEATPSPAPAAPVIDPKLQEYIASLERQNRETQARLAQEAAVTSIARRQEALEADGLAPDRAQAIATEIVQATQQAQAQIAEMRAKVLYAVQLADQHKVSVASLMEYATPEAMLDAVKRLAAEGSQAAELARLREENAKLKAGQVPPQTFDSGRGQGSSGGADYAERLRSGKPLPTAREIDAMTARFLAKR